MAVQELAPLFPPDPPISFTQSVDVYTQSGPVVVKLNNGADQNFTGTPIELLVDQEQLNQFIFKQRGFAGFGVTGIKVDGKILVDAGNGTNGFYLPFDPAASDGIYSNFLSSDGGRYRDGNSPDKAFDGDSSTICESSTQGVTSQVMFNPPNNLFRRIEYLVRSTPECNSLSYRWIRIFWFTDINCY